VRKVATLTHELRDDPVETRSLVVQRYAERSHTLLTSTQCTKVLSGLGCHVAKELKLHAAGRCVPNRNVHVDVRSFARHVAGARGATVLAAGSRGRRVLRRYGHGTRRWARRTDWRVGWASTCVDQLATVSNGHHASNRALCVTKGLHTLH